MPRPAIIRNVVVETAGGHGIGLYNNLGWVIGNTVIEAGTLAANTYSGIITSNVTAGSRVEDNMVYADGLEHAYNISGGVRVGGNATPDSADTKDYEITTPNIIFSRAYTSSYAAAGELEVGAGTFRLPFGQPARLINVRASVAVAPTGANIIIDVNLNGASVFTSATKPTIVAGTNMSAVAFPDTQYIDIGEYLTVDIDQVGSTLPGEDLTVTVLLENDITGGV